MVAVPDEVATELLEAHGVDPKWVRSGSVQVFKDARGVVRYIEWQTVRVLDEADQKSVTEYLDSAVVPVHRDSQTYRLTGGAL